MSVVADQVKRELEKEIYEVEKRIWARSGGEHHFEVRGLELAIGDNEVEVWLRVYYTIKVLEISEVCSSNVSEYIRSEYGDIEDYGDSESEENGEENGDSTEESSEGSTEERPSWSEIEELANKLFEECVDEHISELNSDYAFNGEGNIVIEGSGYTTEIEIDGEHITGDYSEAGISAFVRIIFEGGLDRADIEYIKHIVPRTVENIYDLFTTLMSF